MATCRHYSQNVNKTSKLLEIATCLFVDLSVMDATLELGCTLSIENRIVQFYKPRYLRTNEDFRITAILGEYDTVY